MAGRLPSWRWTRRPGPPRYRTRSGAGRVEISAERRDGELHLSVWDNGAGLAEDAEREGVGLRNTRQRLAQLYDGRSHFALRNRAEGGVEAELIIPFRVALDDVKALR